jgi:hypothetical protein
MSKRFLIIESHIDLLDIPFPAAKYYANVNRATETSDYWGMNPLAIEAIMSDAGLVNIEHKILNHNRAVFKGEVCFQTQR